jgi:hypothetical protein
MGAQLISNYLVGYSTTTYTSPSFPGINGNIVHASLSATGQFMVIVTLGTTNNVYYSTDFGATFVALTVGSLPMVSCAMSADGSYLTVSNVMTVYTLNRNTQGFTVTIGNQAGVVNQGQHAIAIGNQAGHTNQSANSIVLNASGSAINSYLPGLFVTPIANHGTSISPSFNILGYGSDSQIVQSSALTILQNGNVGIGTNNPTSKLHIVGDGSTNAFTIQIVQSTALTILQNGNVGIGTANPVYKFDISGNARVTGSLIVSSNLTGAEVYTNNWFRVSGTGGVFWESYARGIQAADSVGASYGNITTYGTGINTWNGYDINGRYTFMANGDTIGVHDRNHSWVWRNVNTVMYINKTLVLESVAQNSDYYSQVAVLNGTTLQKSQCMMRNVYFHNNVGWSGGVNMTYAFHRSNSICPVRISGKYSGFCGGNNMLQITIRIYSHAAGTYTYYALNNFTNNGGNHHTVPLDHIITDLPYTGWHDIYLYNTSGWQTDTNDQLTVNVQLLPVRDF